MKHIKTLNTRDYKKSLKKGGCGECQHVRHLALLVTRAVNRQNKIG